MAVDWTDLIGRVANDETPPFRPQMPPVNTHDHQLLVTDRLTTGLTTGLDIRLTTATSYSSVSSRIAGLRTRARGRTLPPFAPDSLRSTKESMSVQSRSADFLDSNHMQRAKNIASCFYEMMRLRIPIDLGTNEPPTSFLPPTKSHLLYR